jgi:hypothetical protein
MKMRMRTGMRNGKEAHGGIANGIGISNGIGIGIANGIGIGIGTYN